MNTRWHEEDIAGRVLEQIERKEIKGRVISIPAIAEADDPNGRLLKREIISKRIGSSLMTRFQQETH